MAELRYTLTGMDRWLKATDSKRFNSLLQKNIRVATDTNALLVRAKLRQQLRVGMPPPNARLTIFIKGKNRTLWDSGGMFRLVSSTKIDPFTAFIGIKEGSPGFEIAKLLTEGSSIKVTPAMRGMFFYLWLVSTGKMDPSKLTGRAAELYARRPESGAGWRTRGWKPLSPGTSVIRIPGRDFVTPVFRANDVQKLVTRNWEKALELTFFQLANPK